MIMKIARKCLNKYRAYARRKRYFADDPNTYNLNRIEKKRANKLGFSSEEYVIFELKNNSHKAYLSELDRLLYREKIRDIRQMMDNKLVCYSILKNYVDVNKIYAYRLSGDKSITFLDSVDNIDQLIDFLKVAGKLVYKRISAGGGHGFILLEYDTNGFYQNRTACSEANIKKMLKDSDDYIIEEYCQQSEFEQNFFPYSVNTIRIITLGHKDGSVELAYAIQRIGLDAEKCVDNAGAGGLFASVDLSSGELSVAKSRRADLQGVRLSQHPVTGAQIEGTKIPNWSEIIDQLLELHRKLRFMGFNFIAWDVALTVNGIRIIEANATSGMKFVQMFTPQRNDKIGLWMKEWGYLK